MSISNKTSHKFVRRASRHRRVRAKIAGTGETPRLCVFRSNRHIFAQLIVDLRGKTLAACGDGNIGGKQAAEKNDLSGKCASAFAVGSRIARLAGELKISRAVFDRGGYRYHRRVKSLAEGARAGGLKF
jgi:large subunit ribosomal protein L18